MNACYDLGLIENEIEYYDIPTYSSIDMSGTWSKSWLDFTADDVSCQLTTTIAFHDCPYKSTHDCNDHENVLLKCH